MSVASTLRSLAAQAAPATIDETRADGKTPVISGLTLAEIDAEIARDSRRLAFPGPIEEAFERLSADQRLGIMIKTATVALVLYDLFLINDWLMLNDRFHEMLVARLGIFTPVLIAILMVAHRHRSPPLREGLSTVAAVLAVALPMGTMVFSSSPNVTNYQYGSLLVMMFLSVVQRVRFRYAVAGLLAIFVIQVLTTGLSGHFDGRSHEAIVMVFATSGLLLAATSYVHEQSDRRQFLLFMRGELLRAELERSACTDALTGLYNRRHLAEVTGAVWTEASGTPRVVCAILIDIDHFKLFNDSRGHLEGDTCLRRISACIARVARERSGLAFRYGGEEMLVLLPDIELGEACSAARAILAAIRAAAIPHPALGEAATVSASLGVAGGFVATTAASALIAAADTALYAAKRAGRDRLWPPLGEMAASSTEERGMAEARPAA